MDAYEVYEAFFSGEDPEIREFLLLNGGSCGASSASEAETEEDDGPPLEIANCSESGGAGRCRGATAQAAAERINAIEASLPQSLASQIGVGSGKSGVLETSRECDKLTDEAATSMQPAKEMPQRLDNCQATGTPHCTVVSDVKVISDSRRTSESCAGQLACHESGAVKAIRRIRLWRGAGPVADRLFGNRKAPGLCQGVASRKGLASRRRAGAAAARVRRRAQSGSQDLLCWTR